MLFPVALGFIVWTPPDASSLVSWLISSLALLLPLWSHCLCLAPLSWLGLHSWALLWQHLLGCPGLLQHTLPWEQVFLLSVPSQFATKCPQHSFTIFMHAAISWEGQLRRNTCAEDLPVGLILCCHHIKIQLNMNFVSEFWRGSTVRIRTEETHSVHVPVLSCYPIGIEHLLWVQNSVCPPYVGVHRGSKCMWVCVAQHWASWGGGGMLAVPGGHTPRSRTQTYFKHTKGNDILENTMAKDLDRVLS